MILKKPFTFVENKIGTVKKIHIHWTVENNAFKNETICGMVSVSNRVYHRQESALEYFPEDVAKENICKTCLRMYQKDGVKS